MRDRGPRDHVARNVWGVTGGPAVPLNGATYPAIVIPEMEVVGDFAGGPVLVTLSADATNGTAYWMALTLAVDGATAPFAGVGDPVRVSNSPGAESHSLWSGVIFLSPGRHRIEGCWWSSASTATGFGTRRHMSVVEL